MTKKNYDFKNVKLVALDLDGTLLDDHLDVSQRTKETIRNLVNRGIFVAFVSGRMLKAAELVSSILELRIPIVAYNGAKVFIPEKEEIFCKKIPLPEALKVIKYGEERDLYVKVYIDDILYIKEPDKKSLAFSKSRNINYKVVGKLSENIKEDVNMIVVYYKEDRNEVLDEKLKDINVTFTTSMSGSIEAIPKGISKDKGLMILAEHLNIKSENILAIGNGLNDLEMLSYAGIGIAMKNSEGSLLKEWDNISEYTNNEEGVYHILKQI
ncbi:MAG: Cof-like protein hydrolase [Clostridiales bacterium]|nr:Cof-like protein hydrolase [Clostridiales bacterium]